jgi:hypothetical protein
MVEHAMARDRAIATYKVEFCNKIQIEQCINSSICMVLVLVDIEKDIFYSLINLLSIPLKIKPWKGKTEYQ